MANTITGRIVEIGRTEQIPSKDLSRAFLKREIVLDATRYDPWTGERSGFENFPQLEFTGDKCAELDRFAKGQVVTITFDLQGMRYQDKDGNVKYFTKARPYKIEARQPAQQPAQATQRQSNPTTYAQQPGYMSQPPVYPPQEEPPFQRMSLYDTSNPLQKEQFKARSAKLAESGKVVELTEKKPKRSLQSNKYLHVILGYFACETGNTLEWVKQQYYKKLVNPSIFIRERDDKYLGRIKILRSFADLDSAEMSTSITRFRNWASAECGIYLPSADEDRLIQLMEIEIERNKDYL